MGLFDGISMSNPIGGSFGQALGFGGATPTSVSNAWNMLTTGANTPFGAGDQKGVGNLNGMGWANAGSLGQLNSATNGPFESALMTGQGTPWGPGDSKGFQGTAPMNAANLLPGLNSYQGSLDTGVFGSKPADPNYQTDPTKFKAADYSDVLNSGKNQVAENLASQNANILAQQQGQGALNSGSTGLGLSQALNGAQSNNQALAGQVGQMQLQDQYNQLNAANNQTANQYASQMNKYNQGQQALGTTLGSVAGIAKFL